MKTRKTILIGLVTVIGLLAFTSVGVAFAATRGGSGGAGWSMMGGGRGAVVDQTGVPAGCDDMHDAMQAAIAKELGITVDDLNAQLAAGKTVADIAAAKGLDFATVMQNAWKTLQQEYPGFGPGMMGPGHGPGGNGPSGNGQGYGPGMMGGGYGPGANGTGYGPGMMGGWRSGTN